MIEVVILGLMAAAALLWAIPTPCRCEKCGFHVNERNVERMKQIELRHEAEHRGFGDTTHKPDLWDCADITCPRNKMNRPS